MPGLPIHLPRFLLIAAAVLYVPFAAAQAPGTPGPLLPVPQQTNIPVNLPLDPRLPTIFIVGDSTARNKADLGWGDHFAHYVDTSRVNIANRAIAGRSSRSYINEGSWDKTLAEIKPGDYVLIQMGHNDGGTPVSSGFRGRGSGKGIGPETAEIPIPIPFTTGPLAGRTAETLHTYGWYLRKYIADTRAKGATPILLTVTVRDIWSLGADGQPHIERDMGFRDYEYQVGAAGHVPVIDMATVAADKFEYLGPETTRLLFPIDHTHTSAVGAEMNAASVVTALRNANSPLVRYLAPPRLPTYDSPPSAKPTPIPSPADATSTK
jgi:rhamnogalacturonan acetylesterase